MPPTLRVCENCGYKVAPGVPRRSYAGKKLCEGCFDSAKVTHTARRGQTVNLASFDWFSPGQLMAMERTSFLVKKAHDSGDQVTIYHCPFCGSGQVIARSDRTTECTFCHGVFTVQVQPQYSAFPQTIDGQPVEEPGAPGMDGQPDVAADEELAPEDGGGFPPDAGMDDGSGFPPDDAEGDEDESSADEQEDDSDDDSDDKPAFLKGSRLYRTASGHLLTAEDMIRHLALQRCRTPEERQRVLAKIRAERGLS